MKRTIAALLAAIAISTPSHAALKPATYSLVIYPPSGESYQLEYGLSRHECLRAVRGQLVDCQPERLFCFDPDTLIDDNGNPVACIPTKRK